MKIPLRYQITEFDCGTTSLLNAISYIFNREEIPANLVHEISTYTLDNFDKDGNEFEGGTSVISLGFIQHWINQYVTFKKMPLKVRLLEKDDAILAVDKAAKLFANKGCILASVWLMDVAHYVIITNIDDNFAYIFDPYYVEKDYFSNNDNIEIIKDMPFSCNRKIKLSQLYLENKEDYSLIKNDQYQELMIIERS